jgi:pimeloyl-ACP methyl ester carboxylesterase
MGGKIRWVNMMIPGIDGEDERRGSYDGTLAGFSDLFLRIVGKLGLKRVIICAHSFGSTVGFHLASVFPQIVEGFINIAGLSSIWPIGMSYMYKACIVDNGCHLAEWKRQRLYDSDEHRDQIYADYVNNYK